MKEKEAPKVRGRIGQAQKNLMDYMDQCEGKFVIDPKTMSVTYIKRVTKMLDGLVKRGLVKFIQLKRSSYYKLV